MCTQQRWPHSAYIDIVRHEIHVYKRLENEISVLSKVTAIGQSLVFRVWKITNVQRHRNSEWRYGFYLNWHKRFPAKIYTTISVIDKINMVIEDGRIEYYAMEWIFYKQYYFIWNIISDTNLFLSPTKSGVRWFGFVIMKIINVLKCKRQWHCNE